MIEFDNGRRVWRLGLQTQAGVVRGGGSVWWAGAPNEPGTRGRLLHPNVAK